MAIDFGILREPRQLDAPPRSALERMVEEKSGRVSDSKPLGSIHWTVTGIGFAGTSVATETCGHVRVLKTNITACEYWIC